MPNPPTIGSLLRPLNTFIRLKFPHLWIESVFEITLKPSANRFVWATVSESDEVLAVFSLSWIDYLLEQDQERDGRAKPSSKVFNFQPNGLKDVRVSWKRTWFDESSNRFSYSSLQFLLLSNNEIKWNIFESFITSIVPPVYVIYRETEEFTDIVRRRRGRCYDLVLVTACERNRSDLNSSCMTSKSEFEGIRTSCTSLLAKTLVSVLWKPASRVSFFYSPLNLKLESRLGTTVTSTWVSWCGEFLRSSGLIPRLITSPFLPSLRTLILFTSASTLMMAAQPYLSKCPGLLIAVVGGVRAMG